jgi:hypothetical protein
MTRQDVDSTTLFRCSFEVVNCISMQNLPEACTWHSIGAAWRSCLCRLHLQWAWAGGERGSDVPGYGSTGQLPQPSPKQQDASLNNNNNNNNNNDDDDDDNARQLMMS